MDWSVSRDYNKRETFDCYRGYLQGKCSIDELAECFVGLAYEVLDTRYSGIYDFDREDLIVVSVWYLIKAIQRSDDIFGRPIDSMDDTQMRKYAYRVLYTRMKDVLMGFNLSTGNVPVLPIERSRCKASPEYAANIKCLCAQLPIKIIEFIKSHNRFSLSKEEIEYYVLSILKEDQISHRLLRNLFKRKNPAKDIDNIRFLYKWALYEVEESFMEIYSQEEIANLGSVNVINIQ